jgi:putative acetyltransferase
MMEFTVRDEKSGDEQSIHDLTRIAFEGKTFSNKTEHLIVDTLRSKKALAVSLVAIVDGNLVGHVAFSLVTMSEGKNKWYALGPISVIPPLQKQGIGSGLIREGLARIQLLGAAGCVIVGNPRYYTRFGFEHDSSVVLEDMPPAASLVLRFVPNKDRGFVRFHDAFSHP